MAKLRSIGSIAARRMGGTGVRRTLALTLAVALTMTSAAPAWALKAEVEAEGEGSAPVGTLPGLEAGPELEGEETVLGEEPPLPGEEVEETIVPTGAEVPGPKVQAPVEPPQPEASAALEAAPAAPPVPSAAPEYEAEASPTYEPEAPAPAVVHGEAIVAPVAPQQRRQGSPPSTATAAAETAPVAEAPPAEPPAEVPEPAPTSPQPATEVEAAPGTLQGHDFHTVAPGESLWSIATAVLPPGTGNAEIARKVRRLWQLNAARIGTGQPSLILVGTVLRLH